MMPEFPSSEVLPMRTGEWVHHKYAIEGNIKKYIVSLYKDIPEIYDPLDGILPEKKPKSSDKCNIKPHLHLANLNIDKDEKTTIKEVLGFVNRWGLLGLWDTKYSSHKEDFLNRSFLPKDISFEAFHSNSILNRNKIGKSDLTNNKLPKLNTWVYQEPLALFIEAVKEFQELTSFIAEQRYKTDLYFLLIHKPNIERKLKMQNLLNLFIKECNPITALTTEEWISHWNTPSLLHSCYLSLWMDLTALRKYSRCKHKKCNKVFLITDSEQEYCSVLCYRAAKRSRGYYKGKAKKEGF